MYVYVKSEPGLYTVGFYAPDGTWHTDSDHQVKGQAAERVAYLNGSADLRKLTVTVNGLEKRIRFLELSALDAGIV